MFFDQDSNKKQPIEYLLWAFKADRFSGYQASIAAFFQPPGKWNNISKTWIHNSPGKFL